MYTYWILMLFRLTRVWTPSREDSLRTTLLPVFPMVGLNTLKETNRSLSHFHIWNVFLDLHLSAIAKSQQWYEIYHMIFDTFGIKAFGIKHTNAVSAMNLWHTSKMTVFWMMQNIHQPKTVWQLFNDLFIFIYSN